MTSYRTTTVEDLTYIKRLNYLADVFGDETADVNPEEFAAGVAFYVDRWHPEDGIIAFDDLGVPAGAAWLLWGNHAAHGAGFVGEKIPELAVAVEQRAGGQGIGGELLHRITALAGQRGATQVSLCVHKDNDRARLWYERSGFEFVREEGDYHVMLRGVPESNHL